MRERGGQFGNHFGQEARARGRIRRSAVIRGIAAFQSAAAAGEISPEVADQMSGLIFDGWKMLEEREIEEEIGRIVRETISPERMRELFMSTNPELEEG